MTIELSVKKRTNKKFSLENILPKRLSIKIKTERISNSAQCLYQHKFPHTSTRYICFSLISIELGSSTFVFISTELWLVQI